MLALLGLATGYPFLSVVVASPERIIRMFQSMMWPLRQALQVSVAITVTATVLGLLVTAALAYGLSRPGVPGSRPLRLLVLYTMLFQGGMVPFYLVVRWLGLTNTFWSLVIPFLVNAWYLFILVRFFEGFPSEVADAAHLDGCNDLQVFACMVLPMSRPALAAVGLFYAADHWNQWFWAMVFLEDRRLHPLQLVLRGLIGRSAGDHYPIEAMVLTALPILVLALVLQRHLQSGDLSLVLTRQ